MPRTRLQGQDSESAIIDLVDDPVTITETHDRRPKRRRQRSDDSQPEMSKRRRNTTEEDVEVVETDDAHEGSNTVTTQSGEKPKHTRLGAMSCIICMESYTDATAAHCGHIFCHECLSRALAASERNTSRGIGVCPSCRKPISRRKANQIIPINFLKKTSFKRRTS